MKVRIYTVNQQTWATALRRECDLSTVREVGADLMRARVALAATGHYWFGGDGQPLYYLERCASERTSRA